MRITPIARHRQVVFLGNFNPSIIHPSWLALHGLIGKQEAEGAKVEAVLPEVSQFSIEQRMSIQVTLDRFSITSDTHQEEIIRDLAVGLFGQQLPHTPMRAMGVNMMVHFECASFEKRYELGTRLAPPERWGEWSQLLGKPPGPITERGGMISLSMRQVKRADSYEGHVQAKIEPSKVSPERGVFMEINDHYNFATLENPLVATKNGMEVCRILEEQWSASGETSEFIVDQIMALASEGGAA